LSVRFTFDANVLIDVLRSVDEDAAFETFLRRHSHATHLSAVVMLELRAGARTPSQVRHLETFVFGPFERRGRMFAPSVEACRAAGALMASLAKREGWASGAAPSLMNDALLATSCRQQGITLITRDADFQRFAPLLPGWRPVAPWPD
jgi:predicted nucleic acid-binding protein